MHPFPIKEHAPAMLLNPVPTKDKLPDALFNVPDPMKELVIQAQSNPIVFPVPPPINELQALK
jgi:hypothetical protein